MLSPAMLALTPTPAWALVLRELLETGVAEVWEVDGVLGVEVVDGMLGVEVVEAGVEVNVLDDEVEVLVAVEAGMEKVLLRSLGAGASKASAMGLLQSTMLLVVLQQFHCLVVALYTMSGRGLLAV
jgi:hypothetical protein